MNYRKVLKQIGKILIIEGAFMILPMIVCLIYGEYDKLLSFAIPLVGLLVLGFSLNAIKQNGKGMYVREGLVIVGVSWVLMSIFGALPYLISGTIDGFVNAFFEAVSGFTTTGSSVIADVESLSKGILFWRSLTHFVGGMGVLVFMLAIMPEKEGKSIHIYRAETTGVNNGKLVSKMRFTARILYLIYTDLTIITIVALCIAKMPIFDSVCHGLSVAGTGGFSTKNTSIAGYSNAIQIIITIAMFVFSINFTLYYLLLIGRFKEFFKNEEFRTYIGILIFSILTIALSLIKTYNNFAECLKFASFQVLSIVSTTGFYTAEFTNSWHTWSLVLLMALMAMGAMGGSTGGGIKVSRVSILFKSNLKDLSTTIRPRHLSSVNYEGKRLTADQVKSIRVFIVLYAIVLIVSALLLSAFGNDLITSISTAISSLGNVGPNYGANGFAGYVGDFNVGSKLVLCFDMLAGRLELLPIIALFMPSTWRYK